MTTYVGIIDRKETIIVDGYSTAKTLNGLMHDISRLMKKICPHEAEAFNTNGQEDARAMLDCTPSGSDGGFYVVVDEVEFASRLNNAGEIEYKDGYNYYFCTRVVK